MNYLQQWRQKCGSQWFLLFTLGLGTVSCPANAQIIPDNTLGSENSTVTPISPHSDRIDGGAIRGSNLFHSFQEFGIKQGNSAYFANPEAIQTIFSRVTGNNPSLLFGTLGVLGNANLFFINPNGIIFGPNASLDMRGSFVASTAQSIVFPDGSRFSATNPEGVPLLRVDVPVTVGLQFEEDRSGTIINAGDLATGKNLALVGGTIVSTGELSALTGEINLFTAAGRTQVQMDKTGKVVGEKIQPLTATQPFEQSLADWVTKHGKNSGLSVNPSGGVILAGSQAEVKTGDILVEGSLEKVSLQAQTAKLSAVKDLTLLESWMGTKGDMALLAKDGVRIRDGLVSPFVAVAGRNLTVQGDRQVDIFALAHPASGLAAGRDLILRSGKEVIGDAHYWSGGSFRVEKLDGSLGDLTSPNDPIIRSQGDVYIDAYQGGSLHIIAGGKVEIPGYVWITGADSVNGLTENVTLSNGQIVAIRGKTEPTLDIRAGVKPEAIGTPIDLIGIGNFYEPAYFTDETTSADINLGTIFFANISNISNNGIAGRVLLTNKYQPNNSLTGNIQVSNTLLSTALLTGDISRGGNIDIDSRGSITLKGMINVAALPNLSGFFSGNGGNINLLAQGNINLNPTASIRSTGLSSGNVNLTTPADVKMNNATINVEGRGGGNIAIKAHNLVMSNNSRISAGIATGLGSNGTQSGNIDIKTTGITTLDNSVIINKLFDNAIGKAGDINIATKSLQILSNSQLNTVTSGKGNSGDINIIADDNVTFNSSNISSFVAFSGIGKGGNININTGSLEANNSSLSVFNSGKGNAGNINILANQEVKFDKSEVSANASSGVVGNAGDINITSNMIKFANGSTLETSNFGTGNSGSINIIASDFVEMIKDSSIKSNIYGQGNGGNINITAANAINIDGLLSGVFTEINLGAVGNSGDINLNTNFLNITNQANLRTRGQGMGDTGEINIIATQKAILDNASISTNTVFRGVGKSGNIKIETGSLEILNTSRLNTTNSGDGNGGSVNITASEVLKLDNSTISTHVSVLSESGNAGDININTAILEITNRSTINSNNSGKGNGGNIKITALNNITLDTFGYILTSADSKRSGNGGTINISTQTLSLNNGSILAAYSESEGNSGDINIRATEFVKLDKFSEVNTSRKSTLEGKGGDIIIDTKTLEVNNNSSLNTVTLGTGKAGNVTINAADNVVFDTSRIRTQVGDNGKGDAGFIKIDTNFLSLDKDSQIISSSLGQGNTGKITLQAADSIVLHENSLISSALESTGIGNSEAILLNTPTLTLTDNSLISAATAGKGNAGNVKIENAQTVTLANDSSISTAIETGATATQPSNIDIQTRNLILSNGSLITASTSGTGNAGSITIPDADLISLNSNSTISTAVNSTAIGQGGKVTLNADNITLDNTSVIRASTAGKGNAGDITVNSPNTVNIGNTSQLTVETSGAGKPGNIDITTNTLTIGKDAQLSATTTATASNLEAGGSINLNVNQINLSGKLGIFAETQSNAPAGNLTLKPNNTPNLNILFTDNGFISARTLASGQGGNIDINALQNLDIRGQGKITVETGGNGNAGNINLSSQILNLANGLEISASTTGNGSAGNISLNADQINLQQTTVNAFTNSTGNAGRISLAYQAQNADTINLNNSQISTEIQHKGQASRPSDIDLKTDNLTLNNSTITASTLGKGDAGNITIPNARNITLNQSEIAASTSGQGNTGIIDLNASQTINLNNSQINSSVEPGAVGNSRQIILNTPQLTLDNNAQITASTAGVGNAGNISIPKANSTILNNNSLISTAVENTAQGQGGDIAIQTDTLSLDNQSQIRASTAGDGDAGNINLKTQTLTLNNQSQIASTAESGTPGDGGDINLTTENLILNNASQITTRSQGQPSADAGKIKLQANQVTLDHNSQITATTSAGKGGSIDLTANSLILNQGSQFRTTTSGSNNAGDITLKIRDKITFTGANSGIFADTDLNSFGNGGRIFIDPINLTIQAGAAVSVNSQGRGIGGDIEIQANSLTLDNGKITAQTTSTNGGNITLRIQDLLQLSNGSQISTTAGTAQAGGDGGNIDIDPVFILSNFYDNNDISANAFTGKGGNIKITTQGILGLAITDGLTPFSDITASSEFGLDGNIIINTAGIDPTRGLEKLTTQAINPQIRQGCQATGGKTNAEFYNLGRGGLPENPEDVFTVSLAGNWVPWDETHPTTNLSFPSSNERYVFNPATRNFWTLLSCQRNF